MWKCLTIELRSTSTETITSRTGVREAAGKGASTFVGKTADEKKVLVDGCSVERCQSIHFFLGASHADIMCVHCSWYSMK